MNVGFIGLGNMGLAMARNLLKGDHQLTVYNRTRSRSEELAGEGARVADTPASMAGADVVVSMLADDHAVEEIGIVNAMGPGAIHVGMSTISPALSDRLTAAHAAAGQGYVAAPVLGRPEAAAAARLFILAAGSDNHLDRCGPLFDLMGQRTFHISATPSAANVVKLSCNFLIASIIESLAEAFALARKSGIDPALYLEVITSTLFSAPVFKTYGGLIANEQYQPAGFKVPLGLKDVRLVLAAAGKLAVPMPFASVIHDHLVSALAQGLGEHDWSVLGRIAAQRAGL